MGEHGHHCCFSLTLSSGFDCLPPPFLAFFAETKRRVARRNVATPSCSLPCRLSPPSSESLFYCSLPAGLSTISGTHCATSQLHTHSRTLPRFGYTLCGGGALRMRRSRQHTTAWVRLCAWDRARSVSTASKEGFETCTQEGLRKCVLEMDTIGILSFQTMEGEHWLQGESSVY